MRISRKVRAFAFAIMLTSGIWLTTAVAQANVPFQTISSSGPLTSVIIGNELSCQVAHSGDTSYELYGPNEAPADCGTFIFTGGTLYSPDFANHDYTATASIGTHTPWTPVSQSSVTGAGTSGNPFQITTLADAGSTGLHLTEVDSYVTGEETYRTDVTITNSSTSAQSGILYRAGDCYLQNSDFGYGFVTGGNAPGCSVNPNNSPADRIEQWVPITGGNQYVEDFYNTVWGDIGNHTNFPDTCQCTSQIDNGGGVSWSFTVPAGGSVSFANEAVFSPAGNVPLTTAKTADSSTVAAGGQDGYTITISNANSSAVTLTDITDTLPSGFTYVAGSSTGVTTSNPSVSGQTLTWTGPFSVPANGSVSLHFNVTAPSTAGGPFYDNAGGDASGDSVVPTGNTAPVTVTGGDTTPPTCRLTGTIAGPPKQIQISVQDTGSGLGSVVVTKSTNATTTVAPFTPGTTSSVMVTSTKLNQSQDANVALRVTDVAGNVTLCDPALIDLSQHWAKAQKLRVRHLAQAEGKIQIVNGWYGVRTVRVAVNGRIVRRLVLRNRQTRNINVVRAMRPGHNNTITLILAGRTGGAATVAIHD